MERGEEISRAKDHDKDSAAVDDGDGFPMTRDEQKTGTPGEASTMAKCSLHVAGVIGGSMLAQHFDSSPGVSLLGAIGGGVFADFAISLTQRILGGERTPCGIFASIGNIAQNPGKTQEWLCLFVGLATDGAFGYILGLQNQKAQDKIRLQENIIQDGVKRMKSLTDKLEVTRSSLSDKISTMENQISDLEDEKKAIVDFYTQSGKRWIQYCL